jgi:hypothetical protein
LPFSAAAGGGESTAARGRGRRRDGETRGRRRNPIGESADESDDDDANDDGPPTRGRAAGADADAFAVRGLLADDDDAGAAAAATTRARVALDAVRVDGAASTARAIGAYPISDSQGHSIQKQFSGQLKGDAIKC